MPAAQDLAFTPLPSTPIPVTPVSGVAPWVTAIAAGGLVVLDSASAGAVLKNPGAITHASRRMLVRPVNAGTTLRVRMVYAADDNPSSVLRIRVFGATGAAETLWTALPNLVGEASVDIQNDPATDPYEAFDPLGPTAGYQVSVPHPTAHAWDSMGFSHFLIGVERTYLVLGGGSSANLAYLQAKIV